MSSARRCFGPGQCTKKYPAPPQPQSIDASMYSLIDYMPGVPPRSMCASACVIYSPVVVPRLKKGLSLFHNVGNLATCALLYTCTCSELFNRLGRLLFPWRMSAQEDAVEGNIQRKNAYKKQCYFFTNYSYMVLQSRSSRLELNGTMFHHIQQFHHIQHT